MDSELGQALLHQLGVANQLAEQALQVQLHDARARELSTPRSMAPLRLLRHGYKVFSQCDEDGLLAEIFARIGVTTRTFVEFGVSDGVECNTVKLLLDGWQGLWLEADDACVASIEARFAPFLAEGRLRLRRAAVSPATIDELLRDGGVPAELDLLSIDIDSDDYWVWEAVTVTSPRVVAIEYNATLAPPLALVVPPGVVTSWAGTSYFGASLEALVRLGRRKGYRLVGCGLSGVNAFFVRDDLGQGSFHEPATAEEHYEPPRYHFTALRAGHEPAPGVYVPV